MLPCRDDEMLPRLISTKLVKALREREPIGKFVDNNTSLIKEETHEETYTGDAALVVLETPTTELQVWELLIL